ncbi:hypothetical protein BDB00DRAFT_877915 [Zychaea mexicana]|uniref:uncharacterized protein n=1 Tax=Zychaea mexicana TaxID=64656 RepID=UPI0022FE8E0F|nr:uncharacterized protein BDB00DRAFT_877915 [Zychaea mexicana]KAI9487997.1 hypothetical protein BDB00DRAFT_877915 [Zychaea mexicana]
MSQLGQVFAFHALTHGGLGLLLIFAPQLLDDFLPLANGTATLLARAYGAGLLGPSVGSLICSTLPDMLPCKRATGLGLMVYHALISYLAFQARKDKALPYMVATLVMIFHLVLLFAFYLWYKVSEGQVKSYTKKQKAEGAVKKH